MKKRFEVTCINDNNAPELMLDGLYKGEWIFEGHYLKLYDFDTNELIGQYSAVRFNIFE